MTREQLEAELTKQLEKAKKQGEKKVKEPIKKTELKSHFRKSPKTFKDPSTLIKVDPTKKVVDKYKKHTALTTVPEKRARPPIKTGKYAERDLKTGFYKATARHYATRYKKEQQLKKAQKELKKYQGRAQSSFETNLFEVSKLSGKQAKKLGAKYDKLTAYYETKAKAQEAKVAKLQKEVAKLKKTSAKLAKKDKGATYSKYLKMVDPDKAKKAQQKAIKKTKSKSKVPAKLADLKKALGADDEDELESELEALARGDSSPIIDEDPYWLWNAIKQYVPSFQGRISSPEGREAIKEVLKKLKENKRKI